MEGLDNRYEVKRVDGQDDGGWTGIGHTRGQKNARYFVLRMGPKAPNAHTLVALKAYADSVIEEQPLLAKDLYNYLLTTPVKEASDVK